MQGRQGCWEETLLLSPLNTLYGRSELLTRLVSRSNICMQAVKAAQANMPLSQLRLFEWSQIIVHLLFYSIELLLQLSLFGRWSCNGLCAYEFVFCSWCSCCCNRSKTILSFRRAVFRGLALLAVRWYVDNALQRLFRFRLWFHHLQGPTARKQTMLLCE